jgi:agmatinase
LDETGLSQERADVFIQPIPYDATTSFQPGTRFGPEAILQASQQVELWDEELGWEPFNENRCFTLPDLPPNQAGPESMLQDIKERLEPYWRDKRLILALGGEHSISLPLVRGVQETWPDLVLVWLDAHGDLRDSWEGSPYSHASVLRRIAELNLPILHLGLRSLSREEQKWLDTQKSITCIPSREILFHRGLERFQKELSVFTGRNLYLSLDVDVLDPSLIPGTGTPEPGGLGWFQALEILKIVVESGPLRGVDVCELMPLPGSRLSEFTAAKLIFKILSNLFYHRNAQDHGRN